MTPHFLRCGVAWFVVSALMACAPGAPPQPPGEPAIQPEPEVPGPTPDSGTPEGGSAPESGIPQVPPSSPSEKAPRIEDAAWEKLPLIDEGMSRGVTASAPRFDPSGQLWIASARPNQIGDSLMGVLRWDGKTWKAEGSVSTEGRHSQGFSLALDDRGRMLVGWTERSEKGSDPILLWRKDTGLMPSLQPWTPEERDRSSAGRVLSNAQGDIVYVWKEREAEGVHRTLRSLRLQGDTYVPFATPLPVPDVSPDRNHPLNDTSVFALEDDGGLVAALFDPQVPSAQGLHLWRWHGDAWTELPPLPPVSGEDIVGFDVTADAGSLVVSRSRENAERLAVDVFRWKNGSWEALPYGVTVVRPLPHWGGFFAAVAVDAQQRVWLAHPRPEAEHNDVQVMVWTGSSWQAVGQPLRGYAKPWYQHSVQLRVQGEWAALAWSEPAMSGSSTVFVARFRARP